MEFGKSLRSARETKGYTVSQLAELTRMMPRTIDELENEDFSHIPAPIYGRGFVKLYCEAVGLESRPFVDEFMEIFNGNRDTIIRERPTAAEPVPEPAPAPAPAPAPEPKPEPAEEPAPTPEPDLFNQPSATEEPANEPAFSRYAAPIRDSVASSELSPVVWRVGVLAAAALGILLALIFGIRAIYRAATAEPKDKSETKPAVTAEQPAARTQQAIPSLYVD